MPDLFEDTRKEARGEGTEPAPENMLIRGRYPSLRSEEKQTRLIQTMDVINHRYGQETLCRLATLNR